MSFINARVVASNVDPNAYHKTDEKRGTVTYPVSNSMIGEMVPAPIRWLRGYSRPDTKALTTGRLPDCLLLTPDKFDDTYFVLPETYPAPATHAKVKKGEIEAGSPLPWNANAAVCEAFVESNKGRESVKTAAYLEAKTAVQNVLDDPVLAELLDGSQRQLFCIGEYHDKATGITVPVKGLLDVVPSSSGRHKNFLADYKTVRSGNMRAWSKDVFTYGYCRQAAFFTDLYCAATGEDRNTFAHICQEMYAPFHVEKRILSVEFVELGRNQYLSALALYCRCLDTGVWPGYYSQTTIEGWDLVQPDGWMSMAQDTRPNWSEEPTTESNSIEDDVPTL